MSAPGGRGSWTGLHRKDLGSQEKGSGESGRVQPVPELVQQCRESARLSSGGGEERLAAGGRRLCGITSSS